ncbi:MAG: RagB/SusD family nutrient uptake outer membrane protein, partial [Bacteroides sp.]
KGFPDNKFKTRCVAKYRREYEQVIPKAKNHTPINFPILRYSDVLLMLAEAENYLNGPTGVAYEAINAVRQRAKIKDLPQGLSKEAFLAALKKERAMELCFEAGRRWDLIRWGDFYNSMQGMKHYVSDGEWNPRHDYALEYYNVSPAYVYFPIPDLEIGANPLPQNPGW